MHPYNIEDTIGFHLVKVKGAAAKGQEAYRAVLDHDSLSADETLAELVKETGLPPAQLTYIGSSVLRELIAGTLRDGRSRNFDNLVTTRLDITGTFDRIDAPYDPKKHACVLSLRPGNALEGLQRRTNPVNESKPPRGRFDTITYPDGEKGFVKIGEDILIYGHDLLIDPKAGYLSLKAFDSHGTPGAFAMTYFDAEATKGDPFAAKVLVNTNEFVRLAWPKWKPEAVADLTLRLHYLDCSGKGAHDSFSRPVTILR